MVYLLLQVITDDDVDRISMCVRVVAERAPLMKNIFVKECRNALSAMLEASKKVEEEQKAKVPNKTLKTAFLNSVKAGPAERDGLGGGGLKSPHFLKNFRGTEKKCFQPPPPLCRVYNGILVAPAIFLALKNEDG